MLVRAGNDIIETHSHCNYSEHAYVHIFKKAYEKFALSLSFKKKPEISRIFLLEILEIWNLLV